MLEFATPWLFQEQVVKKNAFYIQEERRGGMMLSQGNLEKVEYRGEGVT